MKSFENLDEDRKTPEKHFKLVPNKVSFRPRLKIRRPGEAAPAPLSAPPPTTVMHSIEKPIALPELTLFRSVVNQPVPLPSVEPPRRSVYDLVDETELRHLESEEPPKPVQLPIYGQVLITVTPFSPTETKTTTITLATEEWNQGSVGEQPPQPSKPLKAIAAAVKTATVFPGEDIKAGEDNALAFGGNIGTPPPGFREAFGLNGAEELFATTTTLLLFF